MVDHMLEIVHWFMLILFVGWSVFLVVVFTKFRQKKQAKADYHGVRGHASSHIEIGVVIVEAILLLGFAFPLWAVQSQKYPTDGNVVKLRAVGEKFAWNFQYAGNDGVLGRTELRLIDTSTNPPNIIGQDKQDPNGKDDFVKNSVMTIPVNRPVIVDVTSKDVIHNLALVPMRMAQDATPGVRSHAWFKPTKVGQWDIICGQLCGPGHSSMRATLIVVPQEEFDEFMKENSESAVKANTPAPAEAAPAPAPVAAPAATEAVPSAAPAPAPSAS
jgi:cytochrome c oxidase subunit 2